MSNRSNSPLSDRNTKLLAIFSLGFLLLNFPILSIFDTEKMVGGIPGLYVYLFTAWLAIIILIFWTIHRRNSTH